MSLLLELNGLKKNKSDSALRLPFGAYNSCHPTRLQIKFSMEVEASDEQRTLVESYLLTKIRYFFIFKVEFKNKD